MKRHITAIVAALAFLMLAVGVLAIAARGAMNAIERQRHDIVGLALDIKSYEINWFKAAIALKGIKIYPAGKENNENLLASVDAISVRIMPKALLKKQLHAESVTLIHPIINLVEYRNNKYNWHALDLEKIQEAKDNMWHVWIESIKIKDGIINYRSLVGGHRVNLTDVDMSFKDITSSADPKELPTILNMTSDIDQKKGKLAVQGRLNAFAEGINFKIYSQIKDAPITYFHSFYAGQTPYPITSGTMNMTSRATAEKSMLVAYNHASIRNLRVGGGVKGDLINSFILSHSRPVEVDVTVKGNLEEGELHIGSAISKGIGDNIFVQASRAIPLSGAGTKIKEAGSSVGRGIKRLFGR
jgi:uncharacterized protein involved in outer membrane biogenesis